MRRLHTYFSTFMIDSNIAPSRRLVSLNIMYKTCNAWAWPRRLQCFSNLGMALAISLGYVSSLALNNDLHFVANVESHLFPACRLDQPRDCFILVGVFTGYIRLEPDRCIAEQMPGVFEEFSQPHLLNGCDVDPWAFPIFKTNF